MNPAASKATVKVDLQAKQELDKKGSIMVLGPSEYWQPDATHVMEEPLKIRRGLVKYLRDHAEASATLMEEWKSAKGENSTELFERILREAGVGAFVVYWPLGAKLHGLDWEFGILVQKFMHFGFPPDRVYLLVERDTLRDDAETGLTVVEANDEKGNRTRYHHDLLDFGCRIRVWDDPESLLRHTSEVALENPLLKSWNWPLATPKKRV